jgi:hypothetical protein
MPGVKALFSDSPASGTACASRAAAADAACCGRRVPGDACPVPAHAGAGGRDQVPAHPGDAAVPRLRRGPRRSVRRSRPGHRPDRCVRADPQAARSGRDLTGRRPGGGHARWPPGPSPGSAGSCQRIVGRTEVPVFRLRPGCMDARQGPPRGGPLRQTKAGAAGRADRLGCGAASEKG